MSYREPSEPTDETDPEALAIAVLRRRAGWLRTAINVPLLLGGLGGGVVLYVALRDLQLATRHVHFPWLTAIGSILPMFAGSVWLAPRLGDFVVGRLLPGWRKALAEKHGLDLAELAETTRLLE